MRPLVFDADHVSNLDVKDRNTKLLPRRCHCCGRASHLLRAKGNAMNVDMGAGCTRLGRKEQESEACPPSHKASVISGGATRSVRRVGKDPYIWQTHLAVLMSF